MLAWAAGLLNGFSKLALAWRALLEVPLGELALLSC
ncbi:hypothetical protein CYB_0158 [Synechococcus sp. JA-2-3B'a(2-13)]|nr:hypothetical protein CYB_0158 [Synechococcus sp. JA-2-3B'a(2-13)]